MRLFVLFVMASMTLACGSSKSAEKETPENLMNLPPDPSWVGTRTQIESCDTFVSHMEQCREASPEEVRGIIDWGMKDTLAQWRARPDDAPELCSMANDKAGEAFAESCPGIWPE